MFMSNHLIRCSNCGKSRQIRSDNINVLYARFNVNNDIDLSKVYTCLKCKKRIKLAHKHAFITTNHNFTHLRKELQKQVIILDESGVMNVQAITNFKQNINEILLKYHICHYEYNTQNNNLLSIDIMMPFFGRVEIPILTQETKKRQREFYEKHGGYKKYNYSYYKKCRGVKNDE